MFYFNARWVFKLPAESTEQVAGSVIAVSGLPSHTLRRRRFRFRHLQHRLVDPQLYLSDLQADRSASTVGKLATYPWFPSGTVPAYDSSRHGTQKAWKEAYSDDLLAAWRDKKDYDEPLINGATAAAIEFQEAIGVDGIILPGPLTRTATTDYSRECAWLDAGLLEVRRRKTNLPVFGTVAISDVLLRPTSPGENHVLAAIIDQVSSREMDGVYLVPELSSEDNYTCGDSNTVEALLTLVDELVRGARMRVVVAYAGAMWPLLAAAGAETWVSGYYLGQRKLRLSEFEGEETDVKFAYPRYHSLSLLGDIGLGTDMDRINQAGLLSLVRTNTSAANPLHNALESGLLVANVPGWQYSPQNISSAGAHYTDVAARAAAVFGRLSTTERVDAARRWLDGAVKKVDTLRQAGIRSARATEISHQSAWLRAFENWLRNR